MSVITAFVLYFLFFAFIHSALAADFIKKKVKKRLKDNYRFYRIIYNVISFLTVIPAFLVWIRLSSSTLEIYRIPEWLIPVFIIFRLLALGLFSYALLQTDILEFAGLTQGKVDDRLITNGAYRIVRHPFYAGIILLLFTKTEMTQLDITAVVLFSVYMIAGAFLEERKLVSKFGDEYLKYRNKVSMFIPVKWAGRFLKK